MLIEEIIDGGDRVRHYSDIGMMIRQQQTGELYDEAVDLMPCEYNYEETDIPIGEEAPSEEN